MELYGVAGFLMLDTLMFCWIPKRLCVIRCRFVGSLYHLVSMAILKINSPIIHNSVPHVMIAIGTPSNDRWRQQFARFARNDWKNTKQQVSTISERILTYVICEY